MLCRPPWAREWLEAHDLNPERWEQDWHKAGEAYCRGQTAELERLVKEVALPGLVYAPAQKYGRATLLYGTYEQQALALWFRAAAQLDNELGVGQEPLAGPLALELIRDRHGLDLSNLEFRLGVSRGHVLEVVANVPLDVVAEEEDLQNAVDEFFNLLVGEVNLDRWVSHIDIIRSRRQSGLMMVRDSQSAETWPWQEFDALFSKAVHGIRAQLPPLQSQESKEDWLAFELPVHQSDVIQAERCYASTCLPEALKSALEGTAFSSSRFTQDSRRLVWLEWQGQFSGAARLEAARELEEHLRNEFSSVVLIGSGFGLKSQYLDYFLEPKLAQEFLRKASEFLSQGVRMGFYDREWQGRMLQASPSENLNTSVKTN